MVPVRSGSACLIALFLSACGGSSGSGDKLPLLPPDSSLGYTSPPPFTVTIPISPIVPTRAVYLTNFTIIPNLPSGLVLDPTTGVISGTPTQVSATTRYTVSVPDGTVAVTATLVITVNPLPLNIGYRPASDSLPIAACGSPDICYDPHANPFTQLEQAKVRARSENKLILVVAGNDGCINCLHDFLEEDQPAQALLDRTFVQIHVYVGEDNDNHEFFDRLPGSDYVPHYWILSADGEFLGEQDPSELEFEDSEAYDPKRFASFVGDWSSRA